MFRPTDRQRSLFSPGHALTDSQARRLRDSWAPLFLANVLPLLFAAEESFADLYHADNGRPNWGIARMFGIMLLQELHGLTDQEALDCLCFDLRWQHALDLSPADAYLARRSLLDNRARLRRADPDLVRVRALFDQILLAASKDLGISTAEQRLDSTHIVSNIRTRGRLDLFSTTVRHFLRWLRSEGRAHYAALDADLRTWAERDHEGWFARSDSNVRAQHLEQLVCWCDDLILRFDADPSIAQNERFLLLKRLFSEQCEIGPMKADAEGGAPSPPPDHEPPEPQGDVSANDVVDSANQDDDGSDDTSSDNDDDSTDDDSTDDTSTDDDSTDDDSTDNGSAPTTPTPRTANQKKRRRRAAKGSTKARVIPTQHGRDITLRAPSDIGGGSLQSPFDPDAGYGHKGCGYDVQIAETCNNTGTELITDYAVHPAHVSDHGQAAHSVGRLRGNGIAPDALFADSGYVSGFALLDARAHGFELVGPALSTRLPADYIGRDAFKIDPETGQVLLCPMEHAPLRHGLRSSHNSTEPTLHAYFDGDTCRGCDFVGRCAVRKPNNGKSGSFHIELMPELIERDQALGRQKKTEWWKRYAIRGGIEATNSELKRAHGLGQLRVRGGANVRLAVVMKLMACNIKRWGRAAAAAAASAASGGLDGAPQGLCAALRAITAANDTDRRIRTAAA